MADGGKAAGGLHSVNAWENELWPFSNSDNSTGSDENLGKKVKTNNPKCSKPREAEAEAEAWKEPPTGKRKRTNGKQATSGGERGNNDEAPPGGGGGGGKGGELEHEMHIWTERERRKKMRSMFSNLQALLPQLPSKADKATVVDEGVKYIRTLQQKLQNLQKQKLEILHGLTTSYDPHRSAAEAMDSREAFLADQGGSSSHELTTGVSGYSTMFKTWASPNMVLSVCGDKAQINICCPKKMGLFSALCYFFEKHKLQVLSAHISSDQYRSMFMFQAQASGSADPLSNAALSNDDIFQLAGAEIMMYMSTLR